MAQLNLLTQHRLGIRFALGSVMAVETDGDVETSRSSLERVLRGHTGIQEKE